MNQLTFMRERAEYGGVMGILCAIFAIFYIYIYI